MQPRDVLARVLRRRDRAIALGEDVRVVVALERRVRAEIPHGAHALARGRVRLEEVLREDVRRVERVQEVDDRLDGLRDDRPDVVEVILDRREGRRERYAGRVEQLGNSPDAPVDEIPWAPMISTRVYMWGGEVRRRTYV